MNSDKHHQRSSCYLAGLLLIEAITLTAQEAGKETRVCENSAASCGGRGARREVAGNECLHGAAALMVSVHTATETTSSTGPQGPSSVSFFLPGGITALPGLL